MGKFGVVVWAACVACTGNHTSSGGPSGGDASTDSAADAYVLPPAYAGFTCGTLNCWGKSRISIQVNGVVEAIIAIGPGSTIACQGMTNGLSDPFGFDVACDQGFDLGGRFGPGVSCDGTLEECDDHQTAFATLSGNGSVLSFWGLAEQVNSTLYCGSFNNDPHFAIELGSTWLTGYTDYGGSFNGSDHNVTAFTLGVPGGQAHGSGSIDGQMISGTWTGPDISGNEITGSFAASASNCF